MKNKGNLGEAEPKSQLLHNQLGGAFAAPSAKLCLALPQMAQGNIFYKYKITGITVFLCTVHEAT